MYDYNVLVHWVVNRNEENMIVGRAIGRKDRILEYSTLNLGKVA